MEFDKERHQFPNQVFRDVKRSQISLVKKKGKLMEYWAGQSNKTTTAKTADPAPEIPIEFSANSSQFVEIDNDTPTVSNVTKNDKKDTSVSKTAAQDEIVKKIAEIDSDLVWLLQRKQMGILTDEQENDLRAKQKLKAELQLNLKKLKDAQERQRKFRLERKRTLQEACEKNPELQSTLNLKKSCGRPTLEEEQPLLLKSIVEIALHGSAAHEKRQSNIYRSIKTLDELTKQLQLDGFKVSRSGVYLRLLPRRSDTREGKRHVTTVPVKLIRAKNDHHKKHPDGIFCTATLNSLVEVASLLGPDEAMFLSQDDKSRVPIGITAANKQAPLLMHVEYRVTLPDHDWVVADRHKLIPSVIAAIEIQRDGLGKREAVAYSGPTYIGIRSGRHSSSTALSHGLDFNRFVRTIVLLFYIFILVIVYNDIEILINRLLTLPEFDSITKTGSEKSVKPVVIFTVDGGPDENPRYQKVISVAIHHFIEHNLDALFVGTNAPGRSAFNRVERKMAPLSRELSGLILPHDHFGSHLDSAGKTIDVDLEKKNFGFAGKALSEIWSNVVIDGFPTIAEYINPEESELSEEKLTSFSQKWFSEHVRTSQYFTQIVKCSDVSCFSAPRSSFFNHFPSRFLPPPIPRAQTTDGTKAPDRINFDAHKFPSVFVYQNLNRDAILPRSVKGFKVLPYDLYCCSVQSQLLERVCKVCSLYFASKVMLKNHTVVHKTAAAPSINLPINTRQRPVRVAARRQRELMAIIVNQENGPEDVDWIEEEELDLEGIVIPVDSREDITTPVCSISEHLSSAQWEDE